VDQPDRKSFRVVVKPRVTTTNNQMTIRGLALVGTGLSFHVLPEIETELAERRLVRVLAKWKLPTLSVDALLLPRRTQPAKVPAGLEALAPTCTQARSIRGWP
jgi:DNA-binding transcriptional LysR family regulator